MKKLLFVLAVVAVYGLSLTSAKAAVPVCQKTGVTIVASADNPGVTQDDPKKADVKKESGVTGQKADAKCEGHKEAGCCSKAKESGCPYAKQCSGEKEPAPASNKK